MFNLCWILNWCTEEIYKKGIWLLKLIFCYPQKWLFAFILPRFVYNIYAIVCQNMSVDYCARIPDWARPPHLHSYCFKRIPHMASWYFPLIKDTVTPACSFPVDPNDGRLNGPCKDTVRHAILFPFSGSERCRLTGLRTDTFLNSRSFSADRMLPDTEGTSKDTVLTCR